MSFLRQQQETRLIQALDWLTFDPRLSADAVRQANAVVRAFLGRKLGFSCGEQKFLLLRFCFGLGDDSKGL